MFFNGRTGADLAAATCGNCVVMTTFSFANSRTSMERCMRLVIVDDEPKALLSGAANITR